MSRIKLTVAYDGTNYCGWQRQPGGVVTVEGRLNEALSELTKENIEVIGASRTDSGVHAMGNIAVFDTQSRIPAEKFMYALHVRLPEDIRVMKSEQTEDDFHPRHCDCNKTYVYRIYNATVCPPTKRLYAHHEYVALDVEKMKEASNELVGEHNFEAFCSAGSQAKDTVRTIYSISVDKDVDEITIRVNGNGFLYNMVRIIAGTLIEVGKGRKTGEDIKMALETGQRNFAGPTAPARGLTLCEINYENNV